MAKIVQKIHGAVVYSRTAAGIPDLLCLFQRGCNTYMIWGITIAKFGATHIIQTVVLYLKIDRCQVKWFTLYCEPRSKELQYKLNGSVTGVQIKPTRA